MSDHFQMLLLGVCAIYLVMIALTYLIDRSMNRDAFSVLKLCVYFSLIEALVMLWFAVRIDRLYSLVLAEVTAKYVQEDYIVSAYLLSVLTFVAVTIGATIGAVPRHAFLLKIERKLVRTGAIARRGSKYKALCIFGVGVAVHVWMIQGSGGYALVWSDLHAVETITEGFGWHKAAYSFLIPMGMCLAYPYLYRDRQYLLLAGVVLSGLFCLGALTQRAPVGIALFVLLLTHHYAVRPLNGILNAKVLGLGVLAIGFMFAAVQWRHGNIRIESGALIFEPKLDELEENVIQRLGVTERQVAAIGYMDTNPYWGSGVYQSLLYAYQRRTHHPEKPPVDTGVYIKAISEGRVITPPLPANDMPESSWPDRYLAGYVSCGLVGLIVVAVLSGGLFGLTYRLLIARNGSPGAVFLYGVVGFLGATPLSPLGLVKVGLAVVPTAIVGWLYSITFKYGRRDARALDHKTHASRRERELGYPKA